jgi:hypothetical protein
MTSTSLSILYRYLFGLFRRICYVSANVSQRFYNSHKIDSPDSESTDSETESSSSSLSSPIRHTNDTLEVLQEGKVSPVETVPKNITQIFHDSRGSWTNERGGGKRLVGDRKYEKKERKMNIDGLDIMSFSPMDSDQKDNSFEKSFEETEKPKLPSKKEKDAFAEKRNRRLTLKSMIKSSTKVIETTEENEHLTNKKLPDRRGSRPVPLEKRALTELSEGQIDEHNSQVSNTRARRTPSFPNESVNAFVLAGSGGITTNVGASSGNGSAGAMNVGQRFAYLDDATWMSSIMSEIDQWVTVDTQLAGFDGDGDVVKTATELGWMFGSILLCNQVNG